MKNIKIYDRVRHKSRVVNSGVDMVVQKIEGNRALCSYVHPKSEAFVDDWFDLNDLERIDYGTALS